MNMKLWLLTAVKAKPQYDVMHECVVRAPSEARARAVAQEYHGDETNRGDPDYWLNAEKSSCELLTRDGIETLICRDFRAG